MNRRFPYFVLILLLTLPLPSRAWNEGLYAEIERSITPPRLSESTFEITRYGARPEATAAQNQRAIQRAIDVCSQKGGGRVVVPSGKRFLTGALTLKSGVNLVVEDSARLEFAFEPTLYPVLCLRHETLPHCEDTLGGHGPDELPALHLRL